MIGRAWSIMICQAQTLALARYLPQLASNLALPLFCSQSKENLEYWQIPRNVPAEIMKVHSRVHRDNDG